MATRATTTEEVLRVPKTGTRRSSRHADLVMSSIGVVAYSFLLWLLFFALAPMVVGWSPTVIGSGSMSPLLREGDVVLTSDHDGIGLGAGTVILFSTDSTRTSVMHRIIEVTPEGTYITKGDANPGADSSIVAPSEIQGVARLLVPYAGLPAHWLRAGEWPAFGAFATLITLAVWMAHRRPRRGKTAEERSRFRRWAMASAIAALLIAATAASAMAAFSDPADNPANSLAAGTWADVVVAVAAGEQHTCAVLDDGSAWCWGDNRRGQLGDGTSIDRSTPTRVVGPGGTGQLSGVVAITAGSEHTCAVTSSGAVYCWGQNRNGQLGIGTKKSQSSPVQVDGVGGTGSLLGVVEVDAGGNHTCARFTGGTAACWGDNGRGQVGDGSKTDRKSPVLVLSADGTGNLTGVATLGLGDLHSCAALGSGAAYCWGEGSRNRLGNGSTGDQTLPVQVLGTGGSGVLENVVSIAGGGQHTCAVVGDGSAYCWGRNNSGELGIGQTGDQQYPSRVLGRGGTGYLSGLGAVTLGSQYSCALHTDGTVSCWGRNQYGQLGDGTLTQRTSPVQVAGPGGTGFLTDVSALDAGGWHAMGIGADSEAWVWGRNTLGQLGDGTLTDSPLPVQTSGF